MRIFITCLALALSGCAQWDQMTAQERDQAKAIVAGVVGALVIGYALKDDDGGTIVQYPAIDPVPPANPRFCSHPHHC